MLHILAVIYQRDGQILNLADILNRILDAAKRDDSL